MDFANWLASALGTAAVLEWFNREYGAKASDSMGVSGQAKWEATADFTAKVKTFVKADDSRLKTLFDDWKADGGSTYSAKRDAFIGPTPSFDDKKIMWQSQSNADYLNSYETWRSSNDNGKGQKVLEPKWKTTTSGLYNFKDAKDNWKTTSGQLSDWKVDKTPKGGEAKLSAFINNPAKLNEIISSWKKDTTNDGFDKKAQAWLTDVNAGTPAKSKKDWYWSNSFREGVDTWIQGLRRTTPKVADESLVKKAWYFSPNYMDKAKTNLQPALNNNAALDAWLATPEGIEAIRHFGANNPKHLISTKLLDFWKSEAGSNYNDASKTWLDRVNTKGSNGSKRTKEETWTHWLVQGHSMWDAYKVWAETTAADEVYTQQEITRFYNLPKTLTKIIQIQMLNLISGLAL